MDPPQRNLPSRILRAGAVSTLIVMTLQRTSPFGARQVFYGAICAPCSKRDGNRARVTYGGVVTFFVQDRRAILHGPENARDSKTVARDAVWCLIKESSLR